MQTTLEADNYEDQLKMPEVCINLSVFISKINLFKKVDEDAIRKDLIKRKFIDHIGTDKHGQPIIAIYACRLPEKKDLNTNIFIE